MLLLIMCCICILGGGCDESPNSWPRESFTLKTWGESPKEKRYVYYNDLANSKKLDGLTKKDVLSLLGQPDYTSPDSKYINYTLKYAEKGAHSLNAIYFLEIIFDAQGRVSKYYVRAD